MSTFLGFGTALPEHAIPPEVARETLVSLWPRLKPAADGVRVTRYAVEPVDRLLQPRSMLAAAGGHLEHATRLATAACQRALCSAGLDPRQVDLLVAVSTTGFQAPSFDTHLIDRLGLRADVWRLPLSSLGCAGGAAAVTAAHRYLADRSGGHALVVAAEVPSLFFQPGDRSTGNLAAAMLFGDGAAAAVMGGRPRPGLRVEGTASWLIPGSTAVLGFGLGEKGLRIALDRRLPALIESGLGPIVQEFKERQGIGTLDFYAVHAGGPRVFDAVEAVLGLSPNHLAVTRRVFGAVGNLLSASLLFCLAALSEAQGDGLSIAFGPGVTVELAYLRRC
jgi:predicted naringenin-chalcone synthase